MHKWDLSTRNRKTTSFLTGKFKKQLKSFTMIPHCISNKRCVYTHFCNIYINSASPQSRADGQHCHIAFRYWI